MHFFGKNKNIQKNINRGFSLNFTLKNMIFSEYPIVGSDSNTFIVSSYVKIPPKVIA